MKNAERFVKSRNPNIDDIQYSDLGGV